MFSQISSLQAFYLIAAMLILAVALVYWADTIRDKREKLKKK